MKRSEKNPAKELYSQLRTLTCERLWNEEVPKFNRAIPGEREKMAALIRAVGVVFSESGAPEDRDRARPWLRALLHDPSEKVRRYAAAALPKIGAGEAEESDLLALLKGAESAREKKFVAQSLEKIGGKATLRQIGSTEAPIGLRTLQKVTASVARSERPSTLRIDRVLSEIAGLQIHLRCRIGLERILRDEIQSNPAARMKFPMAHVEPGLVAVRPQGPFTLGDIYAMRCFASAAFVLGSTEEAHDVESVARLIVSPLSRRIFSAFTDGAIRYRIEFVSKGHQRAAVREVSNRAFELCPEILNDPRDAPWTIEILKLMGGSSLELKPRFVPDPRFAYRQGDVPAASHPPLAACIARLAGKLDGEIVWDPFCGSGLELVETALRGGVSSVCGTDICAEAIDVARRNFAAAHCKGVSATFVHSDFRRLPDGERIATESISLIVTNPPMGKRVPIHDLRGLIDDLFATAAETLRPGGRLVFVNPTAAVPPQSLKLQSRQAIDLGGLECRLEKYLKIERR